MPLIYCQTERIAVNKFELVHSYYLGASPIEDEIEIYIEPENNRLKAAIINIGLACKALTEIDTEIRVVGIEDDNDGLDVRYGGEHNILIAFLCSNNDYEVKKLRSLYQEYLKFLDRIIWYKYSWKVQIIPQVRGSEDIKYH